VRWVPDEKQDFVSVLMTPIGYVQGQNWDRAVGSDEWSRFCGVLGSGGADSMLGVVRVPAVVSNLAKWIREASEAYVIGARLTLSRRSCYVVRALSKRY
jgi:hypothetical protein